MGRESPSDTSPKVGESATPLAEVAQAFEEIAGLLEAGSGDLRLGPFSDACSLVSILFDSLGLAFKFAEIEYVAKVGAPFAPFSAVNFSRSFVLATGNSTNIRLWSYNFCSLLESDVCFR
ncbi:hypothetical protein B296_00056682 [Ensete ventricosum]|uniref:Glycolipid transfer protein domain-containing protein n=1 Tax=Ensete ventricosum TaxID=4639 RepID=A0A426X8C6_ENSVE|nr:hypothetical protein B296_00056682 [Ensete ventricosum]